MSQPLNYETPPRPPVPVVLSIVAWLFIIVGILSVIDMIASFFQSRIDINFGVLGVFIGRGLLRLRPGWRTFALLTLWIGFIIIIVVAIIALNADAPANVTVNGSVVGTAPAAVLLIPLALGFFILAWFYRVLTRPDVRSYFQENANTLRGR